MGVPFTSPMTPPSAGRSVKSALGYTVTLTQLPNQLSHRHLTSQLSLGVCALPTNKGYFPVRRPC